MIFKFLDVMLVPLNFFLQMPNLLFMMSDLLFMLFFQGFRLFFSLLSEVTFFFSLRFFCKGPTGFPDLAHLRNEIS